MLTPVTSLGSRSGVNWMRRTVASIERARVLASIVLPTPGTSSMSRWPSASSTVTAVRTTSGLPSMTVVIAALQSGWRPRSTRGRGARRPGVAVRRAPVSASLVGASCVRTSSCAAHRRISMDPGAGPAVLPQWRSRSYPTFLHSDTVLGCQAPLLPSVLGRFRGGSTPRRRYRRMPGRRLDARGDLRGVRAKSPPLRTTALTCRNTAISAS